MTAAREDVIKGVYSLLDSTSHVVTPSVCTLGFEGAITLTIILIVKSFVVHENLSACLNTVLL